MRHPNSEYGEEVLEMAVSLAKAIEEAGGGCNIQEIMNMSLKDFITFTASNGIRFVFVDKRKF